MAAPLHELQPPSPPALPARGPLGNAVLPPPSTGVLPRTGRGFRAGARAAIGRGGARRVTRILPAQRVRGGGGGAGRAGNGRARAGAASTAAAPPAGGGCAASRQHEGAAGPQCLPLPLRPALVRPRPPHGSLRAPSRPVRGSGVLPVPRFEVACGELGGRPAAEGTLGWLLGNLGVRWSLSAPCGVWEAAQ